MQTNPRQQDPHLTSPVEGPISAPQPPAEMFQTLHAELRRLARGTLWKHGGGVSLSANTVLNEAYISMAGASAPLRFEDKGSFLSYAARVMRSLVIDHVRARQALKRGHAIEFTTLNTQATQLSATVPDVQRVHEAIDELASTDPALAELTVLSFFCGLSFAEIAALREVSERTVQRDWVKARAALHLSLAPDGGHHLAA